jgi:hypothetical protein
LGTLAPGAGETVKPPLAPLPCTAEHQEHRRKSRAAAMCQPRLVQASTMMAERKDAIRRVLAHGPARLSDLQAQIGTSKHQMKHTLRALVDAGEIMCRGMKWERV